MREGGGGRKGEGGREREGGRGREGEGGREGRRGEEESEGGRGRERGMGEGKGGRGREGEGGREEGERECVHVCVKKQSHFITWYTHVYMRNPPGGLSYSVVQTTTEGAAYCTQRWPVDITTTCTTAEISMTSY